MDLQEVLQIYGDKPVESIDTRLLVNIRGCNGAGKSTIPMMMRNADPDTFEINWYINGREKVLATVFPSYKFLALGSYKVGVNCGGLDTFKTTQHTISALKLVWNLPYHILLEGIMASTVRQTYIDLFHEVNAENSLKRDIIIYNILPPLQVCLDRVQKRNGGKPVKEEQIGSKWNTVDKNVKYFEDAGFTSLRVSNENVAPGETLRWFFDEIGINPQHSEENQQENKNKAAEKAENDSDGRKEELQGLTKAKKMAALPKYSGEPEEVYMPTAEDLEGYDWAEYYKAPNKDIKINWDNMKLYWYWIAERQNIWYNRTILKQPMPWTDDKILQENKFTNCIRDLDKGTIRYIREILSKMDEPCDDIVKRTKEVMLNTQIYRLFLKWETWLKIGFIYLDTWDEQWETAKANLREMKRKGETIWHAAYFVNDLKSANPDKEASHDKVENAICLCELFHEYIDDTYDYVTTHDMKDCLDYLNHFPAISNFTIYEWMCDWGMSYKHVQNPVVSWTDDSYVNVGPGNKRGLDFIFETSGGMDHYEYNFYLRASWKHYMKRYGFYDKFISQLPEWMNGDLNMRVIEHSACEVSKYLGVYYGIGKCKGKFKNESKGHLEELIL